MNLVAKEYIAAREDEQGALILSQFTGASRELRDAIIVNPYDVDQMAEAIRSALEMDAEERHVRMVQMRRVVKENNIYRWAGNLITELSEIRVGDNESSIEPSDLLKSPETGPNYRSVHLSVVPPRTSVGG